MKHIRDLSQALPLFKCLGSEIRVAILELLINEGPMQMKDIADRLEITCGSLSPHIRMLNENGFLNIQLTSGKHGLQRICAINEQQLIIDIESSGKDRSVYESEIGVGLYSDYQVYPTCGVSTPDHLIGVEDDPRFFASPERTEAGIIWLGHGYVEYLLPNYLKDHQQVTELLVSFEIASEAPGFREDWPSDIDFSINGTKICTWTVPGDFGKNAGIYTPTWFSRNWNQHGQLKFLSVDDTGTYIDGLKRSEVSLKDLKIGPDSVIRLRFTAPAPSENRGGGLTLFGRSFGNYNQDIQFHMRYKEI